jgi:hypothetical protein
MIANVDKYTHRIKFFPSFDSKTVEDAAAVVVGVESVTNKRRGY